MVPKIHKRGTRTLGLLAYLYGPGKAEEHTDPHLVASWGHAAPDPGRHPTVTLKQLQQLLDQPVHALPDDRQPKKHVWHLSVRNAATDRHLTDDEWAEAARRMVAAAGIDDPELGAGCRWVAVRHADDHIHILATLVREDGRKPRLNNDAVRVQAEARLLEAELGLDRCLNPGDGTAAKRPASAERHKATRQGRTRTAREELRETVRQAAAGAASEAELFARLTAAGVLVRTRTAPSGDLLGYKVALADDLNKDGEPVYYPGSKLAPDLSLPRIRDRWSDRQPPGRTGEHAGPSGPARARRRASAALWQAVLVMDGAEDVVAAGYIAAAGEILDALAQTSAAHTRSELREAAAVFERATRSHVRAVRGHDRALRQAARDLVYSGPVAERGEDGAMTAMVIDMVFFLVTAAAHWHARKEHAQQAAAARLAADHLRLAYRAAATQPMAVLALRGRSLALPVLHRQRARLREALPHLAGQVLAEPGWAALAATLADAEAAGHDTAALLADVAARRELASAEQISDVLVWRLRQAADLPADAQTMPLPGGPGQRPARPANGPAGQGPQRGGRR
ncbi:mobilization protein [Streptomyces sp. BPTC-684]|uniref:relaxase/mobilization nuclease domain-containing protein n=1 Tax=Streptomyces sp. BPTC-684 TaxID=3043734 RepID=UPI0024B23921|nr:mobilization protein [Streptomyces sp. BPTC-684]WHM36617.1 mobilization protein [Streptomyces sp. BPTC-684]